MNFASESAVFRWKPAAVIRASGPDAASFLQGQFTNDVRSIAPVGGQYGLWLTLKGKVQADSFIVGAGADAFWIISYHSPAAVIRERLESYIIADDVTLDDQTEAWTGLTLFGADAAERIAAAGVGFSFAGRRCREPHREWLVPVESEGAVLDRLGTLPALTATEMERRRIAAGIPLVPQDIGPGDLPNEGGLDADAISYTKGCYLGQEVMARLKSMGQVRRRLVRVSGTVTAAPILPTPLQHGGRQVGELRSAVSESGQLRGLAMVTLLHVQPGAVLSVSVPGVGTVQLEDAL